MKRLKTKWSLLLAAIPAAAITAHVIAQNVEPKPAPAHVCTEDVEWGALNPARGDKGPRAGTLWGDRTGAGTSGFLVKFADGFSSPPHIHNVTYRGVVISGLVHNDDPEAEKMWMSAGSFWTQPAGQVHITAAKGSNAMAYIEIDSGPYLVHPKEKAFSGAEQPVNVDASNIVWLSAASSTWIDAGFATGPEIAFLWGNPQDTKPGGTMVKLPSGFVGSIRNNGSALRAVVVKGKAKLLLTGDEKSSSLEPGHYFGSDEKTQHQLVNEGTEECILYIRTEGKFDIVPAEPKP
ncbi:DUF4437 domain-containing protein [Oceaniferula spumae]